MRSSLGKCQILPLLQVQVETEVEDVILFCASVDYPKWECDSKNCLNFFITVPKGVQLISHNLNKRILCLNFQLWFKLPVIAIAW